MKYIRDFLDKNRGDCYACKYTGSKQRGRYRWVNSPLEGVMEQ